ncbi:hypothetical protein VCHA50O413_10773 [Vibrio chagasii]|nr:hypothetical protein VCHA34P114_10142 [Vibrio chagasii]CAH6999314.1 hypothetical protein VCHA50O409_10774 [Vibrio chagasii]CAH7035438.1 hypothetical protein VCHA50O402_10774 [Vibrio chagasii]CAH7045167.1 hypothetical protein VCHA52P461_150108 [Vibrio chagasii]CAH7087437.1 hypothetical protein VCHA36P168_80130 [Vibrio chagasii]
MRSLPLVIIELSASVNIYILLNFSKYLVGKKSINIGSEKWILSLMVTLLS